MRFLSQIWLLHGFKLPKFFSIMNWQLHTFPEGKVYQEDAPIRRLKWGTASLIVRAHVTPIVLPMVHSGFEEVRYLSSVALFVSSEWILYVKLVELISWVCINFFPIKLFLCIKKMSFTHHER